MEEVKLSPSQARALNSAGAALLLLDVPPRSQLGFDYLTFTTAERFRGIKMIPPGPHLLHYSPPSSSPSSPDSPSYQWLWLGQAQILPLRLDPPSSSLRPLSPDSSHRYALGVANWDFDRGLGPYQLSKWAKWQALSSCIDQRVLDELERERRRMDSDYQSEWTLDDKKGGEGAGQAKRGNGQTTEQRKAQQEAAGESGSHQPRRSRAALSESYTSVYTAVPDIVIPANASPAEITALHLDRSLTLSALLAALARRYERPSSAAIELLLAELQHAFLSFLVAQSSDAFSHYRHLLHLLSLSAHYLTSHPSHFRRLLAVLCPQLEELPVDLLLDELSRENLWLQAVDSFDEMSEDVEGMHEMDHVRRLMESRFGWKDRRAQREGEGQQEDDDDEYAPVVVRLQDDAAMS